MNIPYRTRRGLKRLGIAALVLFLAALVLWLCWVVWVERFVVYSAQGATLNFDLSAQYAPGEVAVEPTAGETVPLHIYQGEEAEEDSTELARLSGWYITREDLTDVQAVREQLRLTAPESAVLLDVKDARGEFIYSTAVGTLVDDDLDTAAVEKLIRDLAGSGHYLIARVSAMRDREFGLNNVPSGLFAPGRMSLWADNGIYWLNPIADGTQGYLTAIAEELRAMGFDEVVFTDFYFPYSDGYVFDGSKTEALTQASQALVTACATDSFAVSFVKGTTDYSFPRGRCRMYLHGISAEEIAAAAQQSGLADPTVNLVFLAESGDTRYDAYGVLRPLNTVH